MKAEVVDCLRVIGGANVLGIASTPWPNSANQVQGVLHRTSALPQWRNTATLRPLWHRRIRPSSTQSVISSTSLQADEGLDRGGVVPKIHQQGASWRPQAQNTPSMKTKRPKKPVRTTAKTDLAADTSLLEIHKEYPNAPEQYFITPEKYFETDSTFQDYVQKSTALDKKGLNICTYKITFPGKGITDCSGSARDPSKDVARKIAARKLMMMLHSNGFLEAFFTPLDKPTEAEFNGRYGSITSVYSYCATILALPKVEIKRLHGLRDVFQVSIELPERDISVTATSDTLQEAEAVASVRFQAAVEAHRIRRGQWPVQEENSGLTLNNAPIFIEFYRERNGFPIITLGSEDLAGFASIKIGPPPRKTTMTVNDVLIAETAKLPTPSMSKTNSLAALAGAITLCLRTPTLLEEFLKLKKGTNGEILKPIRPVDLALSGNVRHIMAQATAKMLSSTPKNLLIGGRTSNAKIVDEDLFEVENDEDQPDFLENMTTKPRAEFRMSPQEVEKRSMVLKQRLQAFNAAPGLKQLRDAKASLPMNEFRSQVTEIIEQNPYSIVIGATGSGKSTQVPQIVLENGISKGHGASLNIICTQPRRIAAISVAARVSNERHEALQGTVGYHVRSDKKLPKPGGSITYCTTGILLRQLQLGSDEVLDTTSHIIMDEVHERDLRSDFLLTILKRAIEDRRKVHKPVPKLILMSATMDPELFSQYLTTASETGEQQPCPWLTVPGRTFPVKELFLDDVKSLLDSSHTLIELKIIRDQDTKGYLEAEKKIQFYSTPEPDFADSTVPLNLMVTTIAHIAKTSPHDGAILVFLPGLVEIKRLQNLLYMRKPLGVDFSDETKFKLCLVHSSLRQSQLEPFAPVPSGCRKIIISTNIAETSITIPDVQHVVDCGKHREKAYNHATNLTTLTSVWISKSNVKQRAGRAGRVQNGNYYGLFSKSRYDSFKSSQIAEIHRSDLQETCLQLKGHSSQTSIREFLASAVEPPPSSAVESAIEELQNVGALEENEELTPLGRILSILPLHPSLGKMVLSGIVFGCYDALLILSTAANGPGMFRKHTNTHEYKRYQALSLGSQSDHIATINAFRIARRLRNQRGQQAFFQFGNAANINFDEFRAIDEAMEQVDQCLAGAGVIPSRESYKTLNSRRGPPSLNRNDDKISLIKALAVFCFPGNLSAVLSQRLCRTKDETSVRIHEQSINSIQKGDKIAKHERGHLHLYSSLNNSDSGGMVMRDTSEISPLVAALFSSTLKNLYVDNIERVRLNIDDWIPLIAYDGGDAKTLIEFRKALHQFLEISFGDLTNAIGRYQQYEAHLVRDPKRNAFMKSLAEVLELDEKEYSVSIAELIKQRESVVRV